MSEQDVLDLVQRWAVAELNGAWRIANIQLNGPLVKPGQKPSFVK